jgi:four helix bundle protein
LIDVHSKRVFVRQPGVGLVDDSNRVGANVQIMARHDLEDRLVRFGSLACRLGDQLPRTPLGQHVALQMARSSTSSFANYGEVQSAESRRDFIHKLGICLKELRETRTWLKFIQEMGFSCTLPVDPVLRECDELLAILATSVSTARRNGRHATDH